LIFLSFANGDKELVTSKFTKADIYGQLAYRLLYPREAFDEHSFDHISLRRASFIDLVNKLRSHPSQKIIVRIQIDEFQKGLSDEDFKTVESAQKDIGLRAYLSMLLYIAVGLKKFNIRQFLPALEC
jgi:hypothetical protein